MEIRHPAGGDRIERGVLPSLLQVAMPIGRILCAAQPGVPLPDEGGQKQVRLLREMRQSLQDGRGRDEDTQPCRMHPLRNVRPRLSHKRGALPLRLRRRERKYNKNKYGGIKMKFRKLTALLLAVLLLVLSLAACGTKDNDKKADMSSNDSAMTDEPKNAEEALALHKKLLEQENALLSENTELWEKVYMAADKGMAMIEDGKNYGDFLLDTIESAKDQFTDEEYAMLKESATEISNIENKLTELENKYPEIMQESTDGDMSVPAGSDMTNPPDDGSMQKFPAFEGKDLDGNPVKSDELFSGNAVTVVNFWFTTCNPCVGELSELDALNKELAKKGGALIGVNTFTLDGDEAAISEAKDVLAKKGVTYQNVYFASDGEAGKFTTNIFAYPTTYVVDRNGNIVGDPIVGAITEKKQAETLQKLIDQALAADMG